MFAKFMSGADCTGLVFKKSPRLSPSSPYQRQAQSTICEYAKPR